MSAIAIDHPTREDARNRLALGRWLLLCCVLLLALVIAKSEAQKALERLLLDQPGFLPASGTTAQFAELMKTDSTRYAGIIKQARITLD